MSDLMYDEVPVVGNVYKHGDWKNYAVHDDDNIKGFFGDYRFLSNFYSCVVYYEGIKFSSSEKAYQAAKVAADYRHHFQICTDAESKKLWKKFPLEDDNSEQWDLRKYDIMAGIVFDKFNRNKFLRQSLLDTGDKYLEESNHWSDVYWGVDIKKGGQNRLGKILMNTRTYFKKHSERIAEPLPFFDTR